MQRGYLFAYNRGMPFESRGAEGEKRFPGIRRKVRSLLRRGGSAQDLPSLPATPQAQSNLNYIGKLETVRSELATTTPDTDEHVVEEPIESVSPKQLPDTGTVIVEPELLFGDIVKPEPFLATETLITEKLAPHIEIDQAEFERQVYSYDGNLFSFRGREELPIYKSVKDSATRLVGERPQHVSDTDYLLYEAEINETETGGKKIHHVVATKTPLGVVELAMELGGQKPQLEALRDKLRQREYDRQVLAFLDGLVAANYVDEQAKQFLPSANPHAEALATLSLLGDPEAQAALLRKVQVLQEIGTPEQPSDEREFRAEPLRVENLVCVHATKYRPQSDGESGFLVPTTFDATGGKALRNSVHTALNHKVEAVFFGGEWEGTDYVVLSPMQDMMEANGLPTVLNTVDTWWVRNPGESLRFPDATLVEAAGGDLPTFYSVENDGKLIRFKSDGFTIDDVRKLVNLKLEEDLRLKKEGRPYPASHYQFARRVNLALFDVFDPILPSEQIVQEWIREGNWYSFKGWELAQKFIYGEPPDYKTDENVFKLLDLLTEQSVEGISLQDAFFATTEQIGLSSAVKEGVGKEVALRHLSEEAAENLQIFMQGEVSRLAVEEAIKNRGFKVQPGGDWAWGGSWDVTEQTFLLARELGIGSGAHSNTAESSVTKTYSETMREAGEKGEKGFNWEKYDPGRYDELMPNLMQKTRRMLYASGVLVARGNKKS